MHQLASFLSSVIFSPVNWIVVLLIASFIIKRPSAKKRLRIASMVVFIIFSSPLLMNWYANKWQWPHSVIDKSKHYSCGIVLGGFASIDENNYAYFNGAADRFIQILKLYKLGILDRILVTGGNGKKQNKNFGEASFVKQELIIMGVPDSLIIVEDQSNNTADNARNSKRLLDSMGAKPPYLLITSAIHMPRATLLFKKQHVPVEEFACNYSGTSRSFNARMLLPSLAVLLDWDGYFKEGIGYFWYK